MQARHKTFTFPLTEGILKIDSDFDSGNIEQAILCGHKLTLTPSLDPMNIQYSTKQSSKTFFHFRLHSSQTVTLSLCIKNMKILQYFANEQQFDELYRICYGRRETKSMPTPETYTKEKPKNMRRVELQGSYQLHFEVQLEAGQQLFVGYHYPYSFEKCQAYLQNIREKINSMNEKGANVYYRKQLLIESIEGRAVTLLTLTQNNTKSQLEPQSRISKSLFPFYELDGRPTKFSKPYVLLTCRVHPGQTSSSYALEGVINFLLSDDKRAKTLLKYCVFLIVPMINPDGVFHGTYRMDTLGHNLNRFYGTALSHKQPSIFAIQTIAAYYASRIIFFMDFHSHPHPFKGSFIYGNSHSQIQEQTESQLYAKLLSLNSQCFGYNWCNFSTSQMSSRDANELLTKDGSARVQMYKLLGNPLVFTMEMGYHGCSTKIGSEEDNQFYSQYRRTQKIFTTEDYRRHGQSIMVTLLRMLELNSLTGLKNLANKAIQQLREEICKQLVEKEERFRQIDCFLFKKVRNISSIIQESYYEPLFKKYPFTPAFNCNTEQKQLINPFENRLSKPPTFCPNPSIVKLRRQKRDLSLSARQGSQSLEPSPQRGHLTRSYKSTLEPTHQISSYFDQIRSNQASFKFAKQLNLNFNPFPLTERKKIYNIVGNTRSTLKKYALNDLQLNKNQQSLTYATHAPDAKFERVQHDYCSQEKDLIRNYKLSSFSNKHIANEEEDFNQDAFNHIHKKKKCLILPRIPNQSRQKPFGVQVEIQQQYQKSTPQHRHLSSVNIKPTLRANAVRMRNLIKSMK